MKKLLLSLTILFAFALGGVAQQNDRPDGNDRTKFFDEASALYYNITSDTTVEVTYDKWHFNTYEGDIVVPPTVDYEGNTYTVTAIGEIAFGGCEGQLNSVIVPNTVTTICESAFAASPKLSLVILPNSIDSIGPRTFSNSGGLTTLRLPENITALSEGMFYNCAGLTTLEIPSSVIRIEKEAFYQSGIRTIDIPESVTYIGEGAFQSCKKLTSIYLPNSVTEIGPNAFEYCIGLQSIHLPEALEAIPTSMLDRCPGLTSVNIPATVTEIGKYAFRYNSISEVIIPDAVQTIGEGAFLGCSSLVSVMLPNNLGGISASLFQECTTLQNITIPQNVSSIDQNAFKQSGLTSITFNNSLDELGNYAFSSCPNLRTMILPSVTAHIGAGVFYSCSKLEAVIIGGVMEIGTYAFSECPVLQMVMIMEENPPMDGGLAFAYCNDSVRLVVPCGAKEAYENSDWGNENVNIEEDCGGLVGFSGSEWYYEIQNLNGSITYQHLEYAADTTIHHKDVQIIIRTNTLYDKDGYIEVTHEYVYEEDNVVYWWNNDLQEFTVLYNLGAEQGDEWEIKVGTETITMHVDAVEQYYYDGRLYRMLRVSDDGDLFSGTIVCGIGHLNSFFPERLMNRGKAYRVEGMRCYWRNGELVFKYGDEDCDAVYKNIHFGIEESVENQFNIYPNPTDGVLFVETHGRASLLNQTYRITNLMGQTLMTGQITAETQQIDVSKLPAGMYFISLGDMTQKFVIR